MFRVNTSKQHIPMMSDISPELPRYVVGDPTRLRQILTNLVSNAVKFTEKGEIIITAEADPDKPDIIKIAVKDTGIGMSEQQQKNLFSAFSQADTTTTRKYGGTGLGLAICQQLSNFMGDGIGVESIPGHGSTFWVKILLPRDASAIASADDNMNLVSKLKNKKLLILDDNPTYGTLLKKYAIRSGMQADYVESTIDATRLLKLAYQANTPYELLLSDLNMPNRSGLSYARDLAKKQGYGNIPIVLITASSILPKSDEFANTNIVIAADKPLVEIEFLEIVGRGFGEKFESIELWKNRHNDERPLKPYLNPMNILVAEDNPVVRLVMKGILGKCQQVPVFAVNGLKAIEAYKKSEQPFDVIFMDCEMPELDGMAATRQIREWELENALPRTPIVALTAHVLEEQIVYCKECGMDEFMVKPIDLTLVRKVLSDISNKKMEKAIQ